MVSADFALAETRSKANQMYQAENWQAVIQAYEHLSNEEELTEVDLFQLADAFIHSKQGQQALDTNAKILNPQRIPVAQIHYQKAQAYSLLQQTTLMWQALHSATASGFSNLTQYKADNGFSGFKSSAKYQQTVASIERNLKPCLFNEKYRQFDFWLGQWEVYTQPDKKGLMAGTNSITRSEDGCLIREQWISASGNTGFSMNYFNGITEQWVQRWVSNGVVIEYAGGLVQLQDREAMRLEGKIYYESKQQNPQIKDFRGTWSQLNDGVVQQFFEESNDGGNSWYPWFNGYYYPVNESAD
ncbi:hypothetical protein QNI24_15165 [Marinicella sp. X102]|nr:hypothetical protein [Marinicella marina]